MPRPGSTNLPEGEACDFEAERKRARDRMTSIQAGVGELKRESEDRLHRHRAYQEEQRRLASELKPDENAQDSLSKIRRGVQELRAPKAQ